MIKNVHERSEHVMRFNKTKPLDVSSFCMASLSAIVVSTDMTQISSFSHGKVSSTYANVNLECLALYFWHKRRKLKKLLYNVSKVYISSA